MGLRAPGKKDSNQVPQHPHQELYRSKRESERETERERERERGREGERGRERERSPHIYIYICGDL